MSKKNLSLLMDGFMGEANQAESVQEQPKEQAVEQTVEQTEQPAVQNDKQENPKAVQAKASSKKETTGINRLLDTKSRKSKMEKPKIVKEDHLPKPKEQQMPNATAYT